MNQKEKYTVDDHERVPQYLHEVIINDETLVKGQLAQLTPQGHRVQKRDYEFRYGEMYDQPDGSQILVLTFYGPVRSNRQHFRNARVSDVLKVHSLHRKKRASRCSSPAQTDTADSPR